MYRALRGRTPDRTHELNLLTREEASVQSVPIITLLALMIA